MGDDRDTAVLRRVVLTVAVLDDVDLTPGPDGVVVPGADGGTAVVAWPRVGAALGGHEPESALGRLRVATLLRTAALLADGAPDDAWAARHVRALALPPGHPLHPGPGWAAEQVRGGLLDVGLGLLDPPWIAQGHPDDARAPSGSLVVPLPPHGVPPSWWPGARAHADRMGALAAVRVSAAAPGTLRPVGGCDVPTLLATEPLRAALAAGDACGLRAVAVPTRTRGWYDLRRVDPAFVGAAWSATDEPARGLPRPVLVTRDEVALPAEPEGATAPSRAQPHS